jgi:D-beta-D-heptose 7-phosphate kinase/D-beta-D-heptose 1-phosphate adenosyltransferase
MEDTKKYDIVVVSGGFDPVHKGHIRMFKAAKSLGHKVVCGLNSDQWLVNKKGRAFMSFSERAEILESIRYIDDVLSFKDDSEGSAIELLIRVHSLYPEKSIAFANGGDRVDGNTPEKGFCNAYSIDMLWNMGGGKIQSSSELIEKAKQSNKKKKK